MWAMRKYYTESRRKDEGERSKWWNEGGRGQQGRYGQEVGWMKEMWTFAKCW
jgi:hypothetical protein